MQYIEIQVEIQNSIESELIMAELLKLNFESFEETETILKAYIPQNIFEETETMQILHDFEVKCSANIIEQQNWNQVWESNFEPISVDNFVGVRAHFHPSFQNTEYEIVITPKMSFGTGHHATTYMMMQLMQHINFKEKSVFDFGTGTGILAILAAKMGATNILAVDYDDWCIENATENFSQNSVSFIDLLKADTAATNEQFDIVIANINKNIILDNLQLLAKSLVKSGMVLLSGLLQEDESEIVAATTHLGWKHIETCTKGSWIAIKFAA